AQVSTRSPFVAPGISSSPPSLEATTQSESVSQNKFVPPALLTAVSNIASRSLPPDVISDAIGGQYQSPASSITGGRSEKFSSPEKTFISACSVFSFGSNWT